ncbi:testis-expressed protein 9 [Venturia canescens]|uniref:testis-expressed protein 9 n=1 Tax=Venturia canescens TaxID=32260 RepID=UPI001C9CEFB2|nr:testis-expressed protein 9 [Venturia canescens]
MSEDLISKEREFRRLNRELGEKTRDLMREVDSVLISHSTSVFGSRLNDATGNSHCFLNELNLEERKKHSKQTVVNGEENHVRKGNERDLENLTIDEIVSTNPENCKSEAFLRFLKAKIKLLHDELETFRTEYKKKCNYCKEIEAENKKLEDARQKLHNQTLSLKDTIAKLEANISSSQSEIQARGTEIACLKKEIDGLKKELKSVNQQSSTFDTRLNRSLEDNERLRNIVRLNKIEEKELRDQIRRIQESERLTVKSVEKQRSEILQAFKKQTALVDNLKKQKIFLEASRQIELTKEEFSKILDWSPEET